MTLNTKIKVNEVTCDNLLYVFERAGLNIEEAEDFFRGVRFFFEDKTIIAYMTKITKGNIVKHKSYVQLKLHGLTYEEIGKIVEALADLRLL